MDRLFDTRISAVTGQPIVRPQGTAVNMGARRGDPDTSKHAAQTVRAGTHHALILRALLAGEGTDNVIEARILATTGERVAVHKRRPELQDDGLVAFTGRYTKNATRRDALVYEITDAGRAAVANLSTTPV